MALLTTNSGVVLTAVDGRILVTADHVMHLHLGDITDPHIYRATDKTGVHRVTTKTSIYRVTTQRRVEVPDAQNN